MPKLLLIENKETVSSFDLSEGKISTMSLDPFRVSTCVETNHEVLRVVT